MFFKNLFSATTCNREFNLVKQLICSWLCPTSSFICLSDVCFWQLWWEVCFWYWKIQMMYAECQTAHCIYFPWDLAKVWLGNEARAWWLVFVRYKETWNTFPGELWWLGYLWLYHEVIIKAVWLLAMLLKNKRTKRSVLII